MATSASPVHFEFATATRIIFGAGKLRVVGPLAKEFGQHALLVTGRRPERAARLLDLLKSLNVASVTFAIPSEPTTELVAEGVRRAREAGCDLVIGFGGGSALDAAKAIAALLTNPGELLDYLEVVGQAKPLSQPGAPFIAIPTTAGTGTEVTRNAVLASPAHKVKVSLRSPLLLAKVALVDPELTYDLPLLITASTGLDALTQLIEPFVCNRANPLTDALCREGMPRAARSLRIACEAAVSARAADGLSPRYVAAREDMAVASLFSGFALANAGLGAVHGFAAPIGGMFSAPHGAVCAALLPHVMAANLKALRRRAPDSGALRRYDEVAQILTSDPAARAADGVAWISKLCADLKIAPLSAYQVTRADLPALVEKAAQASSMKANPIALTSEDLHRILEEAL